VDTIRVTVWNENRHEVRDEAVKAIYPNGMHAVISEHLRKQGMDVATATLDENEHGLTAERLAETDVLTRWGHTATGRLKRPLLTVFSNVYWLDTRRFHSGHESKIFNRIMGTVLPTENWTEIRMSKVGNLKWPKSLLQTLPV